jgi:4-hydroxymandelate oxidase
MYQAASPTLALRPRTGFAELPFGLVSVARREFTEPLSQVDGPAIAGYFADLSGGFGVAYTGGASWQASGSAYPDMVAALLADLGSEPFDVVVLAASVPDLDPWRSAATRLTDALPGSPLLFAVSDQGPAATFTAVRLAGEYANRHGFHRALVLAMDQSQLPYDTGDAVLGGDTAIALVLERSAGTVSLGQVNNIGLDQLADVLDDLPSDLQVVAGNGIGELPSRFTAVDRGPAGFPCTGIWSTPRRLTLFLDYDPERGDLSVCLTG